MASLINNVLLPSHWWETSETSPRRGGRRNFNPSLPPRSPPHIPTWCQKLILLWGFLSFSNQTLFIYEILHNKSPPLNCRSQLRWQVRWTIVFFTHCRSLCQPHCLFERWGCFMSASWYMTWFHHIYNVRKEPGLDPVLVSGTHPCRLTHFSVTIRLWWLGLFFLCSNGVLQIHLSFLSQLKETKWTKTALKPINTFSTGPAFGFLISSCIDSFVTSFTAVLISGDL